MGCLGSSEPQTDTSLSSQALRQSDLRLPTAQTVNVIDVMRFENWGYFILFIFYSVCIGSLSVYEQVK